MSGLHQAVYRFHHVVHRAHVLELVRLDLLAGDLLQAHHQINGIDAVDVQIGVQIGLELNLLRLNLEEFFEDFAELLQDFGFGVHRTSTAGNMGASGAQANAATASAQRNWNQPA